MKTIVLNIPSRTDRLSQFASSFPAFLPAYDVWPAKTGDDVVLPAWWRRSPNRLANVINRIDILTSNTNTSEPILLCEDDCIYCDNFETEYNNVMDHVPSDWDMIYFGGLHESHGLFAPEQVNAFVLRCRYTIFTHCTLIREAAIPKLLSQLDITQEWSGIHAQDCRIAELHKRDDFHAYAPLQFIAGQRGGVVSDLSHVSRQLDHYFNGFQYYNLDGVLTKTQALVTDETAPIPASEE